jgi:hypothetical protein
VDTTRYTVVGAGDLDETRRDMLWWALEISMDTMRYAGKGEAFAPIDERGFVLYDHVIDRFGFDLGWQMLRPYQ